MDALSVDSRRFGAWADRDYRVAKAVECFGLQFGVHYPLEERPAARNLRLSPLHERMLKKGAVMGSAHGWERPNWFADRPGVTTIESFQRTNWFDAVAREVEAVTTRAAVADLSVFSCFDLRGRDVGRMLACLGSNTPPHPGRIGLIHTVTRAGTIASEFTVARLGDDHAMLTSAAAAEEIDFDLLLSSVGAFGVVLENATESIGAIGIMGPSSRAVLQPLTALDLDTGLPWLGCCETMIAGISARLLRVSYVGELGYEIHAPMADLPKIFDEIDQAGGSVGLGAYGAYAANSMRLEKGYRGWGSDLTSERDLVEAGLDAFLKLDERSFAGRDALAERLRQDGRWQMALLAIESGDQDPFYAHTVYAGDEAVGIVTSAAHGHRTGLNIGLAYLRDPDTARQADEGRGPPLEVRLLKRRYRARILARPPFDPENSRLRG